MKLRELLNKILKPKGPWTQRAAEARMGIPQWKLSNFKNAGDDSDYEKSWQDFLKLLAYCREHNIDPAQDLEVAVAEKETTRYVEKQADQKIIAAHSQAAPGDKKKIIGRVQKGGIESSSGKTS